MLRQFQCRRRLEGLSKNKMENKISRNLQVCNLRFKVHKDIKMQLIRIKLFQRVNFIDTNSLKISSTKSVPNFCFSQKANRGSQVKMKGIISNQ